MWGYLRRGLLAYAPFAYPEVAWINASVAADIYVNLAFQFDMNHDGQLNRGEFEKMLTSATIKAREEAAKQSAMADAATS